MLRFLKRLGRRLGLVRAESLREEALAAILDDNDWFGKLLKELEPGAIRQWKDHVSGEPIMFAWSAPAGSTFTDCHFADADDLLQLAAEQFAAAVIDALQNG